MRSRTPSRHVLGLAALLAGATAAPAPAQDAAGAVATYFAARAWLDAGGHGPGVTAPADVRSAAVVLRLHGRPIGFGKDAGGEPSGSTVDRALRAALADARDKAPSRPAAPTDPLSLARELTLELEVAGARQPLIGRTFEEICRPLEPAEHGLQLTDGDRTAYAPASFLVARRMAAPVSRAVISLVGELGLPARDLPELQSLGGRTALYACPSIRMVQSTPTSMPFTPARVLPAVPNEPPPRAWAPDACGRIVGRLAAQLELPVAGDGIPAEAAAQVARTGLRGDYLVVADRYEPLAAGPAEQALAAWALARAGGAAEWPMPLRDRCSASARRVLSALAETDSSEADPATDPVAVACVALAAAELGDPDALPGKFMARVTEALARATSPAALTVARPHARAMLLDAAAAALASGKAPPMSREQLDEEISRMLTTTAAAELPAAWPFLFDALRRLRGDEWHSALAPHRDALDAARTVLLTTQVRPVAPERPASLEDMPGSYPTSGSSAGRASSQSLRMHLFLAMLAAAPQGRTQARDDEERATLGWANRFLRQLQAPTAIAYCAPAPDRALGGILASPADASQPLAAQAMAILALTETERALARLDRPAPGIGGNGASAPGR